MMTAVQGIVAAGTAAYLTRNSSWENVALTANHLFYIAGIALHASSTEIPYFSFAAKAVFMLTPVFLLEHFRQGQVTTEKSKSFSLYFNRFYYAAAVVSTVVLVALGHTSYGVGFFAVMALDMASRTDKVHEYAKTAFEWSAKGAAVLTFASYGLKLATPRGQYLMGLVAAQMFLPRIWKVVSNWLSQPGSSSSVRIDDEDDGSPEWTPDQQREPEVLVKSRTFRYTPYAFAPLGFLPDYAMASRASGSVVSFIKSLTGNLPFK